MQYQKLVVENNVIEFHNSWTGEETVVVNGREVSRQYSVWGIQHYFSIVEDGQEQRYILTSKVTAGMQVAVDLSKNGALIRENVPVHYGSKPKPPQNKAKKYGLTCLKEYDLEEALTAFELALEMAPRDPEIYFSMACAHSVLENAEEGLECLQAALAFGLSERDRILEHDMLAYLRMQADFVSFREKEFGAVKKKALREIILENA